MGSGGGAAQHADDRLRQFRRSPVARRFPDLQQLPDAALAALLRSQRDPAALQGFISDTPAGGAAATERRRHTRSSTHTRTAHEAARLATASALPRRPAAAPAAGAVARRALHGDGGGVSGGARDSAAPAAAECATPTFVVARRHSRGTLSSSGGELGPRVGGPAGGPATSALFWGWGHTSALAGEPLPAGHRPAGLAAGPPPWALTAAPRPLSRASPQTRGLSRAAAARGDAPPAAPPGRRAATAHGCGPRAAAQQSAPLFARRPVWTPGVWAARPTHQSPEGGRHSASRAGGPGSRGSGAAARRPPCRPASSSEAKACIARSPSAPAGDGAGGGGAGAAGGARPRSLHAARPFVPNGLPHPRLSGRGACGFYREGSD